MIVALIATAYIVAIATLLRSERRGRQTTWVQVLLVCGTAFVPVLLAVLLYHPGFSRFAALTSPLLALALSWLALSIHGWHRVRLAAVTVLALIAIGLHVSLATGLLTRPKPEPSVSQRQLGTSLYQLDVVSFSHWIPRPSAQQGGIAKFGDRYLLATGDGDLYLFKRSKDANKLELHQLKQRVPINTLEFTTAMAGVPVALNWFRVADVSTQVTAQGVRVFASHHYWKRDERCFVLRVSALSGSVEEIATESRKLAWETIYETTPCLPVVVPTKAPRFGGLENGGRMVLLSDDELLLSVGDHALDGWGSDIQAAQDPTISYGKTILINLHDRSSRVFSLGHRNPQGLIAAKSGLIWSTEHGPQGGDELNLIEEGTNYGWPLVTYGVDYGSHTWPLTPKPGSHEGFAQPYFSWIPSIGVSSLVEINSPRFERWHGDLVVSSLIARKLWRLRIRERRVVLAEEIPIGERIRQIIEGRDGELVLWSDRGTIMFIKPTMIDFVSGQSLYRECASCHAASKNHARYAPSLRGVLHRRVASDPDFDYSPAMLATGGAWTRERLNAFLANPGAFIPGTSMQFGGIAEPTARDKLIEFLQSSDSELDVAPVPGDL